MVPTGNPDLSVWTDIHSMLNEYLTGLPIPVIKAKYWPRVESIEFYISTVGAVINAAGEAYVRPMKEGVIRDWPSGK